MDYDDVVFALLGGDEEEEEAEEEACTFLRELRELREAQSPAIGNTFLGKAAE